MMTPLRCRLLGHKYRSSSQVWALRVDFRNIRLRVTKN